MRKKDLRASLRNLRNMKKETSKILCSQLDKKKRKQSMFRASKTLEEIKTEEIHLRKQFALKQHYLNVDS